MNFVSVNKIIFFFNFGIYEMDIFRYPDDGQKAKTRNIKP